MKTTFKTAEVIKEYKVKFMGWGMITIPIGARVDNATACGNDDNYRFPSSFNTIAKASGINYPLGAFIHDISHYRINVPEEFCSPWEQK